jgi:hypothetical protein
VLCDCVIKDDIFHDASHYNARQSAIEENYDAHIAELLPQPPCCRVEGSTAAAMAPPPANPLLLAAGKK